MSFLVSWFFNTSRDSLEITKSGVYPAIDILSDILEKKDIIIERSSNSTLIFKNKISSEYFILSVVPRWNPEIKDVYHEWYVNELFYPHRKSLSDLVKWLTNNDIECEIKKYNDVRVIELSNDKLYIFFDKNQSIRVDYQPPL